jgi:integrase/recombinase XerC
VVQNILELHLAHLKRRRLSEGTIYARKRALKRLERLLDVPLLAATADDLTEWLDDLRVIDNTVCHYASHIRCFYRWCWAKGHIPLNPAVDLEVPVLVRGLPRPIGEEDLMAAIAGASPQVQPWLVLAGWCGLRAKEIARLRRENILDTRRPPILMIAADATKGRRERIVPIVSFALAEIRTAGTLARAGYVFRRADGQPGPNHPAVISHVANRELAELGIPATLHQLRHRFGTEAYRLTKDLRRVQEWMGHADPATTALYTEIVQEDGADLLEALPVPQLLRAV